MTSRETVIQETEYAIMCGFGGNIIEEYQVLRGYSNAMIDLVADQNFAETLIGKLTEVHLMNLAAFAFINMNRHVTVAIMIGIKK